MTKLSFGLIASLTLFFWCDAPILRAAIVTDGGFETPAIPHGTYQYNPTGSAWTFVGFSGIIHENADWPSPPAVDGSQIAFLQVMTTPSASSISQDIMLPSTGWYTLTYHSAGRSRPGHPGDVGFDFLLDSVKIGSGSTYSGQPFTKHSFDFFASHSGIANLRIVATSFAGIDSTAFFDKIEIVPEPSSVTLLCLGALTLRSKRFRRYIQRKGGSSTTV